MFQFDDDPARDAFFRELEAWRETGKVEAAPGGYPEPPPGVPRPTIGALRTEREFQNAYKNKRRWTRERMPSQKEWTEATFSVYADGHCYTDAWPDILDRDNGVRVCDRTVRIPWNKLGRVRPLGMTTLRKGCAKCAEETSAWTMMAQAAWASWDATQRYLRQWQNLKENADRRADDVTYVWPYRLFVRKDGSWKIVDVERDGMPENVVAWTGIISDCAKDTGFALINSLGYILRFVPKNEKGEKKFVSDLRFTSLAFAHEVNIGTFLAQERKIISRWRNHNLREDGAYLRVLAYEKQLDRIADAHRHRTGFPCLPGVPCFAGE